MHVQSDVTPMAPTQTRPGATERHATGRTRHCCSVCTNTDSDRAVHAGSRVPMLTALMGHQHAPQRSGHMTLGAHGVLLHCRCAAAVSSDPACGGCGPCPACSCAAARDAPVLAEPA
jgi:hypothetical protein